MLRLDDELQPASKLAILIKQFTCCSTSEKCYRVLVSPRYEISRGHHRYFVHAPGKVLRCKHIWIWYNNHVLVFFVIPEKMRKLKINPLIFQILDVKVVITDSRPELYLLRKIFLPVQRLYLILPHKYIIMLLPLVLCFRLSIIPFPIDFFFYNGPKNHSSTIHILIEFIGEIKVSGFMHHFSSESCFFKWFELF